MSRSCVICSATSGSSIHRSVLQGCRTVQGSSGQRAKRHANRPRVQTHSVSVVCLDLTKQQDQRILFECLAFANVGAAHVAPPCGTSSAARERPLPPDLANLGTEPLHSAGPALPETDGDKARVKSANCLYVVTVIACAILARRGAFVSCENPTKSHFWHFAEKAACSLSLSNAWEALEDSVFDCCMWGGEREQTTTFKATRGLCNPLRRRCIGQHTHKPWTPTLEPAAPVFPTASEAEHPRELCEAHLSCFLRATTQSRCAST